MHKSIYTLDRSSNRAVQTSTVSRVHLKYIKHLQVFYSFFVRLCTFVVVLFIVRGRRAGKLRRGALSKIQIWVLSLDVVLAAHPPWPLEGPHGHASDGMVGTSADDVWSSLQESMIVSASIATPVFVWLNSIERAKATGSRGRCVLVSLALLLQRCTMASLMNNRPLLWGHALLALSYLWCSLTPPRTSRSDTQIQRNAHIV